MRRGVGIVALIAAALASSSTFAARPGVVFGIPARVIQQPVEQQTPGGATQPDRSLWVTNPTLCAWDSDDSFSQTAIGRWEAGQTVTLRTCVVTDHVAHKVELISSFGSWCRMTTKWDAPIDYLPEIPGSNGGRGVIEEIAADVTNDRGHPTKGAARLEVSWSSTEDCNG